MSKLEDIQDWGRENGEELYLFTGHDSAIIGVARQFSNPPCVVYSLAGIIRNLMVDGEMTHEEALDFYGFNIEGAWFGDNTPYVMQDMLV